MGNSEMSPETNPFAALTAQVEAVAMVANEEIPELNRKPEQLQAQGIELASLAGRHAVQQIVDMSTAVTDRLQVMVDEIDYGAIIAALDTAKQRLAALEDAAAEVISVEVEQAGRLQERENEQIAAILGCRFEAADEMVKRKMQEKAEELSKSMLDPAEKARLERELCAAQALVSLASQSWPVPTAHWTPKKPDQAKPTHPVFVAPERQSAERADEVESATSETTPLPSALDPVAVDWSEKEYVPVALSKPGRRVPVPDFSHILSDQNVPGPRTSSIFPFGSGETPGVTERVTEVVEAAPEAAVAAAAPLQLATEQATSVPASPESKANKKLPERVIAFLENSQGILFLAETIADNVYDPSKRPKSPTARVQNCFNPNREDSKPLRERWEAAGLELQYGRIELPRGDPRNLTGGKAVYRFVYRLVAAGTRKDPLERFEGRPVLWEKRHRFSTKPGQAKKPASNE